MPTRMPSSECHMFDVGLWYELWNGVVGRLDVLIPLFLAGSADPGADER